MSIGTSLQKRKIFINEFVGLNDLNTTAMRTFIICTFSILIIVSGCRGKYPQKFDAEISPGILIGKENCSSTDSLNAWLISLSPLDPNKAYGSAIIFKGKTYNNVVKTYMLDKQFRDSTKTYVFSFYLRDTLNYIRCDISNPETLKVQNITIKEVVPKG